MKTLLSTTAVLLSLAAPAFASDDLRDYSDKSITCDKDEIASEMKEMTEQNPLGPKVLYIKEATEISRKSDELRCRIVVVHSRGKQTGIFRFHNEDGHALVGFKSSN